MTAIDRYIHLDDTNERKALDLAADYVEAISASLGIPVQVHGGYCHQARRTLELHVYLASDIRADVDACRQLSDRLKQTFRCERAGVDRDADIVWIIRCHALARLEVR